MTQNELWANYVRAFFLYPSSFWCFLARPKRHRHLLVLALLLCANTGIAQISTAASDQPKQILLEQLHAWLDAQPATSGAVHGINDRRFKVPLCSEPFSFSFSDNSMRTIAAECSVIRWKRIMRLKAVKPTKRSNENVVYIYEMKDSVEAEERIARSQLIRIKKPRRYAARNALDQLPRGPLFAARNLRKGQTITAADIYQAKYVVVADKAIPAGHPISKNTVSLQRVTKKVPTDVLSDLSGFEHLAANRLLHAGAILRKRDLKKAKLVRRGKQVILLAGSGRYSIETTTTALEDGYFGDQIKLKNIDSNQIVRAIVTGADRANALR